MINLQEKLKKVAGMKDGDRVIIIDTCLYANKEVKHLKPSIEFVYQTGLGISCDGTNRLSYDKIMHRLMSNTMNDPHSNYNAILVYDYIKKLRLTKPYSNKQCDAISFGTGLNQWSGGVPIVIDKNIDLAKIKIRISFERQIKENEIELYSITLSLKDVELDNDNNYAYIKISNHIDNNKDGLNKIDSFILTQMIRSHSKSQSFDIKTSTANIKVCDDTNKAYPYSSSYTSEFNNKIIFQNQKDVLINNVG